jgi:regulator of cell morphogenesis and NO signaling
MKNHWNIQTSVREFVKDNVLCAESFEDLSINFCCEGDSTFETTACRKKHIEPEELLCMLQSLEKLKTEKVADLKSLTPAQLTLHIESKHHEYLKKIMPRISNLLD